MQSHDFTTSFSVDQSPNKVFNAITNPGAWWSEEIEGNTTNVDDVFTYHYEDVHFCKLKLIEVIPDKKVVWKILDNDFNFTKDKTEWIDTTVTFEISSRGDKTQLAFTHIGLVPEYECYEACYQGWTHYIQNSLKSLIETGKGLPNAAGTPQTATEKELTSAKNNV
jgi:uncharacterized protein YndB with AHSA1/START domain